MLSLRSDETELDTFEVVLKVYKATGALMEEIRFLFTINHQSTASSAFNNTQPLGGPGGNPTHPRNSTTGAQKKPGAKQNQTQSENTTDESETATTTKEEALADNNNDFTFEVPKTTKEVDVEEDSGAAAITLEHVSEIGRATLSFGQKIIVPSYRKLSASRNLQDSKSLEEIINKDVLHVSIDSQSSNEQEEIDWKPLDFTSTYLTL